MNKRKLTGVSVCILIGLLVITFLYWNRELRFQSLFEDNYIFESVSDAVQNRNGYTYVIDQGKKAVIVLDSERKLVRKLIGGNENADFFYAARVCGDDSGNIYIADLISGAQGNQIQKDRIIKITDHKREILYEFDYAQCENPPLQYGDILELQEYDGNIYFVKAEEDSIDVYRIMEKNGENLVEKILEIPCTLFVSDAAYDVANEILIITTRLGEVYYYSSDMAEWTPVARISKEQIPWSITSAAGEVYYTDLQSRGIFRFSLYAPELPECVYQSESVLYSICVSEDGSTVTATDNEQYIYLETADNSATECGDAGIGNRFLVFLFWVLLVVAVLTVTVMIIVIILRIIKNIQDKSGFSRMALVVISSVIVAAIASYSSISSLMANHDRLVMDNMQVFAESLRQQIDSEKLKQLGEISDYHSDAYMNIKDKLDSMISASYEHEVYYYYVIYSTDGKSINCLMDYEDTTVCGQPIYEYGDNEYTQVLENGEAYTVSEISSYGSWMFTLLPIRDHSGTIIAELEVGSSLDDAVKEKKELVIENIVTVICSCGVMIMLVLECIFALSFFEKRKGISREKWDITQQMPIRVMVFLVYVTDSMQDAFIAILCSRLYADTLPVSREIAIALPMSLQLMMAAVFSIFGGRFAEKLGIRKVMQLGLISQMAGFLVCLMVPGYTGILIGKLFIGMGMGIVYVTSNTIVSMGGNSDFVESGFADVSAGVLSGVTIGAGLGSIILSFADYRIVYLVGAVLLGCGLLLTIQAKNVKLEKDKNSEAVKSRFHIFKFLINRRVAAFFGFILIPFMISLSYREYFFPLYVEQFGIDEVQIGRIYLGCGMLVIYIGPLLSKYLLKVLGAKRSVVLASLCMALNMGLFVLVPNIFIVLADMVVLSVVISFAYTCQYTYFEGLDECEEAGMGNAMGIYSMFENIGQTLGPVIYGAVLMLGKRKGISLLFLLMFLLVCLFLKLGKKRSN
ncbi:MAG: MFS transporter [Lachnospiraceae bacterium]|nr:MFS transporter [Lachnospiraceae bacterium]